MTMLQHRGYISTTGELVGATPRGPGAPVGLCDDDATWKSYYLLRYRQGIQGQYQ